MSMGNSRVIDSCRRKLDFVTAATKQQHDATASVMAKTVKTHYRTLIGSYTLAVKCNHQRAALMTGSARNRAIWNSRSECQIPPPTGVAYEFPENKIKI